MRAYYFDNAPGDQRLPHDSGNHVADETLRAIHILHWSILIDDTGSWEQQIDQVAKERGYKNSDVINVTKEGLGDLYESKLKGFYQEHMHEDEEIRYVLSGSGYFDVREHSTDAWIRAHLTSGDLIVLPAGIYHRFTVDENDSAKMMRLFKDEPKWLAHNRSQDTDSSVHRKNYLETLNGVAVA